MGYRTLRVPSSLDIVYIENGFHSNLALRALRAMRALRVLRKRKTQATQVIDWLLRSTIPIGWRLRSLREKSYAMFLLA